jgi:hypothetical protein
MADFYEIDFLPVHTSKSGDCICVRYQIGNEWFLHVVDGGYTATAPDLAAHIDKYFGTKFINSVVVTHPDQDHAEGLAPILETFTVGKLWMLRPWIYAQELLPHFPRIGSVENLQKRLRDDYPYIAALEEIALRRGIEIDEPFQGRKIGAFTVLAPSPLRYGQLILSSDRNPASQDRNCRHPVGTVQRGRTTDHLHQVRLGQRKLFIRQHQRRKRNECCPVCQHCRA